MAVRLQEIARSANVSAATVSRVINGRPDPRISEATRIRVLEVAERMGYQPNPFARALVTGRTHVIAVWLSSVWYPFASEVMLYVQREVEARGYEAVVKSAEGAPAQQVAAVEALERQVDGLLVVDRPDLVASLLSTRGRAHRPVVMAGVHSCGDLDWVAMDLAPGVEAAMAHLVEQGCHRIAYVVPEPSAHPSEVRWRSYERFMDATGMGKRFILTPTQEDLRSAAYHTILAQVREGELPDAMLCCNDTTAIGVYRALAELGVRVPEEVALVGCDGIDVTAFFSPSISTIVQPIEDMCRLGVDLLLRRIEKPRGARRVAELTAQFVARESSLRRRSETQPTQPGAGLVAIP